MEEKQSDRIRGHDISIDLLKIQIFSERAHSRLTSQITNTYAVLVGFVVLFYTLFYENVITLTAFIFGLVIFLAVQSLRYTMLVEFSKVTLKGFRT